jgi:hypothetical protein
MDRRDPASSLQLTPAGRADGEGERSQRRSINSQGRDWREKGKKEKRAALIVTRWWDISSHMLSWCGKGWKFSSVGCICMLSC